MSRNIKPVSILQHEKKSHRTKAELKLREEGEKAALSGKGMVEFDSVKKDPIAHKEFLRVKRMLMLIEKNDSLYETVINRYCEILSECINLKEQREFNIQTMKEIRETFSRLSIDMDINQRVEALLDLTNSLNRFQNSNNKIDTILSTKRSMLFAIEKENIFTIASALRTIPKKTEEKEDELLKALKGG